MSVNTADEETKSSKGVCKNACAIGKKLIEECTMEVEVESECSCLSQRVVALFRTLA